MKINGKWKNPFCSQDGEKIEEEYALFQVARGTATPYQWVPTSSSVSNSQGIDLLTINGTKYNISETSDQNEFEIWFDNRNEFKDLNFIFGSTIFPPSKMGSHVLRVPKNVHLFLNVMHNVNSTTLIYNITNSSGSVIATATKEQILNPDYYLGL